MSAEQTMDVSTDSVSSHVREAQIELLYQFPQRVIGHLVNGTLMVAVLWGEVHANILLGWLAVVVAVSALRILLSIMFGRRDPCGDIESWVKWFTISSTTSAALWGLAASAIVWLTPNITYHVFIAFIIAGTCSAATTMTFAVLPALYLFLLAAAGPLALTFVMVGENIYLVMGLMTALLAILMAGQARSANSILIRALTLQEENRMLVADISTARDNLEARVLERTAALDKANASLRDEMAARVETEARLQQAQKMEAIGQLTGGIAHDFNNLLAVIQGNTELLMEKLEGNVGERELQAVMRASERGSQLTRRLLAFSRKQDLLPQAVNVNDLMTAMNDMLGRTLGAAVEVRVMPSTYVQLARVDPGQLENAILNLAINARDAMPDGGQVTLSTGMTRLSGEDILPGSAAADALKPGDYVTISVTDIGSRIPPDQLNKVWEPFFTTKSLGEGTGLGLSMVYGFVRQSGGQVDIESTVGKGTTVRMCLPCAKVPEVVKRAPQETTGVTGGSEYIFVIEDDPDIREMLKGYLSRLGYRVVVAGTAEEAYERLAAHGKPDLFLSDVMLPAGHRGPEIVTGARRNFGPVPAIFMSGHVSEGAIDSVREAGDFMLINKPFELAQMARQVRAVLDRNQG